MGTDTDSDLDLDTPSEDTTVKAAFGAKNRTKLIGEYLATQPQPTAKTAWEHVYRMLLWIDQTTGLAHCYESDKCQPGKPWYGRSLAFHDWVSSSLKLKPSVLAKEIDWLFKRAADELAEEAIRRSVAREANGAKQRKPYDGRGFPKPGEDPELIAIVKDVLGEHLTGKPTKEQWQTLVQRIRKYLALENKRRNLVGEGFEDVIAALIKAVPLTSALDVRVRNSLADIPGFARARHGDKPNKVDLAIIRPKMRTLVTVKWSVRADREKQFQAEFTDYAGAETNRKPWDYIWITNEFDPARLMRACDAPMGNGKLFTRVVHINTEALKATYAEPAEKPATSGKGKAEAEKSIACVLEHIASGRLISLGQWLALLAK